MSVFRLKNIGFTIAVLATAGFAIAIFFGGPVQVAPLASINTPFKGLDNSELPATQKYAVRDGQSLAYRHYAANPAVDLSANLPANKVRVVLIHGSSANSKSMHTLAQALATAGFVVDALDMRGHGESGVRGQISYIGQLEDDVEDFVKAVPHQGGNMLAGFSSGGGFTLRFAASSKSAIFNRYLLLAPFLIQSPTNRPSSGGRWASVGLPRIIALSILNDFGITWWNDLPATRFALNDEAKKSLTESYSFALTMNFAAHRDYTKNIANASPAMKLLVGADDQLIFADRYADIFSSAGKQIPITIVPATNHIGLTLNAPALTAIVAAARD